MHFKVKTVQFVQIEIDQLMPAQLNVPQSTKQLICINISSNIKYDTYPEFYDISKYKYYLNTYYT